MKGIYKYLLQMTYDSDSLSSEDDDTTVVTRSSKIVLINNRQQKYQTGDVDFLWKVEKDIGQEVRMMYNFINCREKDIWDNSKFKDVYNTFLVQNELIKNPFPVTECSEPCPSCKSERTIVYTKQTRSADEATTVFIFCGNCGKTSRH